MGCALSCQATMRAERFPSFRQPRLFLAALDFFYSTVIDCGTPSYRCIIVRKYDDVYKSNERSLGYRCWQGGGWWQSSTRRLPYGEDRSAKWRPFFGKSKTGDLRAERLEVQEKFRWIISRQRLVDKIAVWVGKFINVREVTVQYDPTHTALPWAAVRFLLQITLNDAQTFGGIAEGVETVSRLISRYAIFEAACYLQPSSHTPSKAQENSPMHWSHSNRLS